MAANRPSMKIEIEGFAALEKAFNELPLKLQVKFLRPALKKGAQVLAVHCRRTAPRSDEAPHVEMTLRVKPLRPRTGRVGFKVITGRPAELGIREWTSGERAQLADHMAKARGYTKNGVVIRKGRGKLRVGPGYYPAHVEFGYRRNGKHIPANPWMKRGMEEGKADAIEATAQELSRRLKASIGMEGASDAEAFGGPDVGGGA